MTLKPAFGWFYAALVGLLSVWILQSYWQAVLAACVTVVASWPLYARFASRVSPCVSRSATSLLFTCAMTAFVLAPLMFAFSALLTETHALLLEIMAADEKGMAAPSWLIDLPLVGPWFTARWQAELAAPGALVMWTQRTDPSMLLGWAQSLGQFTARHAFIVAFTILLLYYFYQEGPALAQAVRRVLRQCMGERAGHHVDLAAQAVRASVNSMLVVALFNGCAAGLAYALIGVPNAPVWAAIIGLLSLVPFLGYLAVAALTLQLAVTGAAAPPALAFALGCVIQILGDKVIRPVLAGNGIQLRFVWVLMGCLGGFETLGLVGLVIGPVVLTLARELWQQRARDSSDRDSASRVPGETAMDGSAASTGGAAR